MITILGGGGFIGRGLQASLQSNGVEFNVPRRDESLSGRFLGSVIFCMGVTTDFRTRPYATAEAHITQLARVLEHCQFDSLLYLSSTRVYGLGLGVAHEGDPLVLDPHDPEDLYDISKAMGESLALHSGRPTRVVRLSNVYGPDFSSGSFLAVAIQQAVKEGVVTFQSSETSARDYVALEDAVAAIGEIAVGGAQRMYNVASGVNVSNAELAAVLTRLTESRVTYDPGAPTIIRPRISIERVKDEFGFSPTTLERALPRLIDLCRREQAFA